MITEYIGELTHVDGDNCTVLYPVTKGQAVKDQIANVVGQAPTLTDTYAGAIDICSVNGKSEQVTTTGAQMVDVTQMIANTNDSLDISEDGYVIKAVGGTTSSYCTSRLDLDPSLFAGKVIYLKADSIVASDATVASVQLTIISESLGTIYCIIGSNALSRSVVVPTDSSEVILSVYTNTTDAVLTESNKVTVNGLMVSLAETAWEPYTGMEVSPRPNYPQEIKSVVVSKIKSTGESNQESVVTLSEAVTLRSVGDVADCIVKKNGIWGIEKNFSEAVFDGSEDELWNLDETQEIGRRYYIALSQTGTQSDLDNGVTSMNSNFQIGISGATATQPNLYTIVNGGLNMYVSLNGTETLDEFKAYISANPMTLIYRLAEPTFTALSDTDQLALNSLKSYDTVTYISTDSDIEPVMNINYGANELAALSMENRALIVENQALIDQLNKAVPYSIVIDDEAGTINFIDR